MIDVLSTPIQAPKANAICERFTGSVRRECLDHILIISERQLYRLVKEYVEYFNHARPHQGVGSQIPQPRLADNRGAQEGHVLTLPVLGGLHHDYRRAAQGVLSSALSSDGLSSPHTSGISFGQNVLTFSVLAGAPHSVSRIIIDS